MESESKRKAMLHGGWKTAAAAAVLAAILVQQAAVSSLAMMKLAVGEHHTWEPLLLGLAGLLLAMGASVWAHSIKEDLEDTLRACGYAVSGSLLDAAMLKQLPNGEHSWKLAQLGIAAVLFLCGLHWVAEEIWEALSTNWKLAWPWLLAYFVAATGAVIWLAKWWRSLKRPELRYEKGQLGPVDAVVIFLSSPNKALPFRASKYPKGVRISDADFLVDFQDLMTKVLGRMPETVLDVDTHFGENNWAMPVWAVAEAARKGRLRHVVVIGSNGAGTFRATRPLADTFETVLKSVMGDSAPQFHLRPSDGAEEVNFESFKDLDRELKQVHRLLADQLGAHRICVDITGGTKLCTIVGLMSTLEPGLNALYVSTSSKNIDAYDVQYEAFWNDPLPSHKPPDPE